VNEDKHSQRVVTTTAVTTAVHEDRVKHVLQSNLVGGAMKPEEQELAWEERLLEEDLEMQYDLLKKETPQHTLFADERVAEQKIVDHHKKTAPVVVPPVEIATVDEEIWETIVICAAIASMGVAGWVMSSTAAGQ
jgi:hypothetical protein